MSGDCKSCTCEEFAHEEMVDCNGVYSGDFHNGVGGFTPASWYCIPSIPGGCICAPPAGSCGCPYYQVMLREPPATDGCPGYSINEFPYSGPDVRGPCTYPCSCPLCAFVLQNYALAIRAPVYDGSGPPGMEAMAAMQIWYSGVGTEGIAWVGDCDQPPGDVLYSDYSVFTPPSPMGDPGYSASIDGPDPGVAGTCNPTRAYRNPSDISTGGTGIPTTYWPSVTINKTNWNTWLAQGAHLWCKMAGKIAGCSPYPYAAFWCESTKTGRQILTQDPGGRGETRGWLDLGPLSTYGLASSDVIFTFGFSGWPITSGPAPDVHGYATGGQFWLEIREGADPNATPGTGWTLAEGSVWNLDFWAKSVPDLWDDIKTGADGYRLNAVAGSDVGVPTGGFLPFSFTDPDYGGAGLYLTNDWRFYHGTLVWNIAKTITNAQLSFARVTVGNSITETVNCGCCSFVRTRYIPRGSALIKCVHLYPLGDYLKRGVGLRSKHRPHNADPAGNDG